MNDITLAVAQFIAVPRDVKKNVERHVQLISIAARHGAKLIVFPELSLTGYERGLTLDDALAPEDERLQTLRNVTTDQDITAIVGVPLRSKDDLLIGAIAFRSNGCINLYEKQYLHEGEEQTFIPGAGGTGFSVVDESVGIAICAEITHPKHALAASEFGTTVYAASCFITPSGYDTDAGLLEQYAREHGMVVLMSNYGTSTGGWPSGGRSAIWNENGTLLGCAPEQGEAVIVGKRKKENWKVAIEKC